MALQLRHRMLALPLITAAGLLAVLIGSQVQARRGRLLLEALEQRLAPAAELSRELETQLFALQRQLQDAVAAEDAEALAAADAAGAKVQQILASSRARQAFGEARASALRSDFARYFVLARRTSTRMIGGGTANLDEPVREMRSAFVELRDALAKGTAQDRAEMDQAFGELRAAQDRAGLLTLVTTVVAVLLAGLASAWIVAGVNGPLQTLTRAAARVATEGDLRQTIDVYGDDEVGVLADSFRQLMQRLRTIPETLRQSVAELAAAVGQLQGLTGTQATSLERQSAEMERAANTVQEMADAAQSAAQKADTALQVAQRGVAFGEQGRSSVDMSLESLGSIREGVERILAKSGQLAEQTQQLGEIAQGARDVAEQSHVLSLNASIQAARAGEAGAGFSVVAQEMGQLAEQSAERSSRIRVLLRELLKSAEASVEIMQASAQSVSDGIERAQASGENLREISGAIGQSGQAAGEIAVSLRQQASAIAEVAASIGAATECLRALQKDMGGVDRAAVDLRDTSERLQRLVSGFQV